MTEHHFKIITFLVLCFGITIIWIQFIIKQSKAEKIKDSPRYKIDNNFLEIKDGCVYVKKIIDSETSSIVSFPASNIIFKNIKDYEDAEVIHNVRDLNIDNQNKEIMNDLNNRKKYTVIKINK